MVENPLKITDVTFRDGHQSSLATRMRTQDMEAVAEEMNKAGFYSTEVWGGATFDVATRFLNEDPWERPRLLKKLMMPLFLIRLIPKKKLKRWLMILVKILEERIL